ncbi:flagellar hook-length control protein FliK [Methylobacterium gossipiicola]|uniref:Flagellar hook-length control protein FliK n=1 Tax=Methylobacterium gossipiicola TaxID=582675 RepID=A0A1I2UHX2_9HYPH|nr:flagellar hook-length control protein FliK [Methylobacterium gossipiicola]SFG76653.1 Flagellar hook-length control protein FliK [Methylobacterium gossipiicola]
MAQAFLETDFFVRRAAPAPVRNTAQAASRPAFTLDDPKPDPADAAKQARDTRGQTQRAERDRPDNAAQPDRTNQATTDQTKGDRPATSVQSRGEAPAAGAKVTARADAADTGMPAGAARGDRSDAPAPTAPQASSEATPAEVAQAGASLSGTDEPADETDVSKASVRDPDVSLIALGLLTPPPPMVPNGPSTPGQASASAKQEAAGQIQGGAAQAAAKDQGASSSGAVSAAAGQIAFFASTVDEADAASALQATSSAQPAVGTSLTSQDSMTTVASTASLSKEAATLAGAPTVLAQAGASNAAGSDASQLGQTVSATGQAQSPKDEPPAAGVQAMLAAPVLSDAAKSGPKPAGQSVAAKGTVQLTAGVGQAAKGVGSGSAVQEAAPASSGSATVGKLQAGPQASLETTPEASSAGKSDPAVAVQDVAGGKEPAVSVAALPMPDVTPHQGQDSFSAHLAGAYIGATATTTAGASAPTAPAAHTPPPASPPVPLGAVPMTIGLRSLQGSNQFEIRLDPGELGRIDVKLDIDKERGTVMAHLVVDRIETLALLQRDAPSLQQALSQAGLDANEANINLSLRSDAQSNGQGAENRGSDGRSPDGRPGNANGSHQAEGRAALEAIPLRTLTGLTGLDIRI